MTIVTFTEQGARIHEGADPKDFKGQQFLVDPTFPRGVPPHQWKLVNGFIEGTPASELPIIPRQTDYTVFKYIGALLLGALIEYLIRS
jgi:hypothetical protein